MNLVLFEPDELAAPLPRADARARHILEVLRRQPGDSFDAGVVDGPIGKATLVAADDALTLSFAPTHAPPPLPPITLLLGLARPQTARDLLRDATTFGAAALHFVATERSDRSYGQSSLWTSGEWRRQLLVGAAQAFDTRLPVVTWAHTLADVLAEPVAPGTARLALDNYEATAPLGAVTPASGPVQLALGPERGWGPKDRERLRDAGFTLVHLGTRVLRVETACIAALAIVHGRRAS
jgi:RsmE family RNA methyltransferase